MINLEVLLRTIFFLNNKEQYKETIGIKEKDSTNNTKKSQLRAKQDSLLISQSKHHTRESKAIMNNKITFQWEKVLKKVQWVEVSQLDFKIKKVGIILIKTIEKCLFLK